MPAPAYVGAGTYVTTQTKDTTIQPTWPGGTATAGHIAVCQVAVSDQGSAHTPPSIVETALQGFRQLGPQLQAIGFANNRSSTMRLYYKVLAGGDTAPSFQMTGGDGAGPQIGVIVSTYTDVGVFRLSTGNVGDATTITGTGITTLAANGLIAAYSSVSDDGALSAQAFTDPASPTERYDHETGFRMGMHLATGVRTTAGATGNYTATLDETDPWCVMVLAMEETEAFPSEAVIETFTYSDGELSTLSADWEDDTFGFSNTGVSVASNRASNSSTADERSYYATQHEADGEIAATVPVLAPTNEKVALAWRVQAPATAGVDGYEVETHQTGTGILVQRVDNQTFTPLMTFPHPLVAGDKIGVRFTGSLHEFFVVPASGPKVHVGSLTDGTYTGAGYGGICIEGTTAKLDDVVLGPLVAGGGGGIAFNMDVTAALEATPIVGVLLDGRFTPTATMTVGIVSGTPWPGGPGAGVGGSSKGRRIAIFARRMLNRR